MSFATQKEQFSKDKEELDPSFKPKTNIPANIVMVRSVKATRAQNPQGEDYAVFKLQVDVETEDGISTKEWNISSETLVDTLEEKGVDIGSSFTVLKSGEGYQTKYVISNVKNKPVAGGVVGGQTAAAVAGTPSQSTTTAPSAPTTQPSTGAPTA